MFVKLPEDILFTCILPFLVNVECRLNECNRELSQIVDPSTDCQRLIANRWGKRKLFEKLTRFMMNIPTYFEPSFHENGIFPYTHWGDQMNGLTSTYSSFEYIICKGRLKSVYGLPSIIGYDRYRPEFITSLYWHNDMGLLHSFEDDNPSVIIFNALYNNDGWSVDHNKIMKWHDNGIYKKTVMFLVPHAINLHNSRIYNYLPINTTVLPISEFDIYIKKYVNNKVLDFIHSERRKLYS
jgi:hypothetical protein